MYSTFDLYLHKAYNNKARVSDLFSLGVLPVTIVTKTIPVELQRIAGLDRILQRNGVPFGDYVDLTFDLEGEKVVRLSAGEKVLYDKADSGNLDNPMADGLRHPREGQEYDQQGAQQIADYYRQQLKD
jgi:hypothetical protein